MKNDHHEEVSTTMEMEKERVQYFLRTLTEMGERISRKKRMKTGAADPYTLRIFCLLTVRIQIAYEVNWVLRFHALLHRKGNVFLFI